MNIEYTNTISHKKKHFLSQIFLVLTFLLLIPTVLIFIGYQNQKTPTGNFLSPLPQGQLANNQQPSLPQDITIASPQQQDTSNISTENSSNATTTTITLPAGQTQLEIADSKITSDSYIYLIPHTKINQTLSVASKKEGSFILTTNQPFDLDISLDYLVINH